MTTRNDIQRTCIMPVYKLAVLLCASRDLPPPGAQRGVRSRSLLIMSISVTLLAVAGMKASDFWL